MNQVATNQVASFVESSVMWPMATNRVAMNPINAIFGEI
jgi:hypothetical protein